MRVRISLQNGRPFAYPLVFLPFRIKPNGKCQLITYSPVARNERETSTADFSFLLLSAARCFAGHLSVSCHDSTPVATLARKKAD